MICPSCSSIWRHQHRRLELQDEEDFGVWHRATVEKVLPDATVVLRYDNERATYVTDLTKHHYRWIYGDDTYKINGPPQERKPIVDGLVMPAEVAIAESRAVLGADAI